MKIPSSAKSTNTLGRGKASRRAERHREVIRAAYRTLAEKGFEGLRMREIAKRAGMDHATLHYYFAGKEALIHGVLDYIVEELSIGRNSVTEARDTTPRRRLAAHFEELVRQARERPEMFIVLAEINARSMRDPAVRSVVLENDRRWKHFLMQILNQGIQRKEFDPRLNPDSAAEAILSLVRGLSVVSAGSAQAMERPLRQLLRWLESK
jgi:TetR/AcrR family transcriptional repressor of nem operon